MNGRQAKYLKKKAKRDNDKIWKDTLNDNLFFRLILAFCIVFKLKLPFKAKKVKA